jgi:hypothetical protein
VDLADGREFVRNFSTLSEQAAANDVLLVCGASTLPGLSSVVVSESLQMFSKLASVEISIAPAQQTPRGIGTMAAVLSYCGKPFNVFIENRWRRRYGWQDIKGIRYQDLGFRWAAACDVPDLDLFPLNIKSLETVTFHAALEAQWEQLALWLMAATVRMELVNGWSTYAGRFQKLSKKLLSLGSDGGGMQVTLGGTDAEGRSKTLEWVLTARQIMVLRSPVRQH